MLEKLFNLRKLGRLETLFLKESNISNKDEILEILTNTNYKKLDDNTKAQILKSIDLLVKRIDLDFMDKKDILNNFIILLNQGNENIMFREYVCLFCVYPLFFFRSNLDLKNIYQINNPEFMKYLWVEVALCLENKNFWPNIDIYEKIVCNSKLKELNLIDVIVNGLINTFLDKSSLLLSISYLLSKEEDYSWLILKLFQAPTTKHIDVVIKLVNDEEINSSNHIEEMVDIVYKMLIDDLNELVFHLNYKMVYEEMPFKDACKNYHEEAMKILDEENDIKSYSLVRVPIYKRR